MTDGGREAVRADNEVVSASVARRFADGVRELERQLGRKTLEAEILEEALERTSAKS